MYRALRDAKDTSLYMDLCYCVCKYNIMGSLLLNSSHTDLGIHRVYQSIFDRDCGEAILHEKGHLTVFKKQRNVHK
jgi:hypothetical protein